MQPLKDYLNESPLSEGIFDQIKVNHTAQSLLGFLNTSSQKVKHNLNLNRSAAVSRMTADDMIRQRIREYCEWDRKKHIQGKLGRHGLRKLWPVADEDLEITNIDKDDKGWYVETMGNPHITFRDVSAKSFYDYCISLGQKIDGQKGFLIEDIDVYFRWRVNFGAILVHSAPNLESTKGLPEKFDVLFLQNCCKKSKKLDVCNKIKEHVALSDVEDIKISGNGFKNILIDPVQPCGDITAPSGVKIYRPKDLNEFGVICRKLADLLP